MSTRACINYSYNFRSKHFFPQNTRQLVSSTERNSTACSTIFVQPWIIFIESKPSWREYYIIKPGVGVGPSKLVYSRWPPVQHITNASRTVEGLTHQSQSKYNFQENDKGKVRPNFHQDFRTVCGLSFVACNLFYFS